MALTLGALLALSLLGLVYQTWNLAHLASDERSRADLLEAGLGDVVMLVQQADASIAPRLLRVCRQEEPGVCAFRGLVLATNVAGDSIRAIKTDY